MNRKLAPILLALLIAGCAAGPPQPPAGQEALPAGEAPPRPVPPGPEPQRQTARAQLPALPAAAQGLAVKAEQVSAAGDHEGAAALLEWALRIAPDHPVLWQNLAVVRYRQGDYAQTESLALKSNSLAGGVQGLKRQNWSLIATARRLRGDEAGARQAQARIRELSGD